MRTLLAILIFSLIGCAGTRPYSYNYVEKRMESTMPGDKLTYNIYENEWRYAAPSARPQFNYYEKRWEYAR